MGARVLVSLVAVSLAVVLKAEPARGPKPGEQVLRQYLANNTAQRACLRNVSMEVNIEAQLPTLKKHGVMHALRRISKLGKITYQVLGFQGDNMIKKDVIARYIEAEVKSSGCDQRDSIAVNTDNYKFKYRGMYGQGDWKLHLFEVKPKKKKLGLFQGWLWIEAKSGLPVRESGRLVKNPSVFLKRVDFMRDYEMRDGVAVPTKIESEIRTRLVGKAQITIRFGNVSFHEQQPQLASRQVGASQ